MSESRRRITLWSGYINLQLGIRTGRSPKSASASPRGHGGQTLRADVMVLNELLRAVKTRLEEIRSEGMTGRVLRAT
ncbi:hypothetical protein EVAR_39070_1 [Eumeta japonica]|uniref:Uncharacterized protein n=1 Tax=Eumeta variegata TaxID=151549 RepID=A0A4C1WR19_EUMVA|nr:hypothetical protein EVAR_39070_1 [Eumeta japonica]